MVIVKGWDVGVKNSVISQVKDVIYSSPLAPGGLRPLVCIDEAQVKLKH